MTKLNNFIQAPPRLMHLATPSLAKTIARNMINKYSGLSADAIGTQAKTLANNQPVSAENT